MFTGIIEAVGKVLKYDGNRLSIRGRLGHLKHGESVCVDGVCLTVVRQNGSSFSFDVGPETARITTLGKLRSGAPVNLERALRAGERISGHFVLGHVEATGRIERIVPEDASRWFWIRLPKTLSRHIVTKGSIAVDGISLTIAKKKGPVIGLMIIPHTLKKTALASKRLGDRVNIEPDILMKRR